MRRLFQFPRRTDRAIRRDVDDELRFHLDERAAALVAGGMDPAAARAQALREFGDLDDARRCMTAYDRRTETATRRRDTMGELRQDLRYAIRQLRSAPGFTLAAVLTLALGIGANTAIFSVVSHVLLRALPYPEPGQLVKVWSADRASNNLQGGVSPVDVDDWRAQKRVIADVGGWFYMPDGGSGVDLTGEGDPQRLQATFFTPGFFGTFGVAPLEGRLPREDEMVRGGPDQVVVLSHAFWLNRFGGEPSAVGRTLTLGGRPYQVIGVMPPAFRVPAEQVDVYIPYSTIPDESIPRLRAVRILEVAARIAPGHGLAEARAEMNTIAARLAQEYRENRLYDAATVEPLREAITGRVRTGLLVLLGAVAFVLVMACVNVAGLLLARGAVRGRELAVRAALGAGRGRIVRQLLTESLVLSLAGGAVGIVVARLGLALLLALAAGQLPRGAEVRLDGPMLLFALALSVVTGLAFGLAPALRAGRADLQGTLREGGRGQAGGGQRLRNVLVVAEVALAVVLVVGAGLMARSFVALLNTDPGFRPDHLVAVNFTISTARHRPYQPFYHQVIDDVRALPGVLSAGAAKNVPFRGGGERQGYRPEGVELPAGSAPPTATFLHVSDGYFATIGAVMREGREFTSADGPDDPLRVIVNETLARRWFPAGGAVGRGLLLGDTRAEIVGVVNDIRQTAMDEPAVPSVYLNNMQNGRVKTTIVARSQGDPLALAGPIRDAIWARDKDQTITSIFTFADVMDEALARPRLLTVLLGLFGGIGLLLGALGLYGLLAYLVNQRRREIGVRLALGADAAQVLRMVVGRGLALAGVGVALGLAGAFGLTRFLRGVLYGVGPGDPWTFTLVPVALVGVAALASWLPARRAAAVDPIIALRSD